MHVNVKCKHKETHMQCHTVGVVDIPMGNDRDMHCTYVHTCLHAYVVLTHTYMSTCVCSTNTNVHAYMRM